MSFIAAGITEQESQEASHACFLYPDNVVGPARRLLYNWIGQVQVHIKLWQLPNFRLFSIFWPLSHSNPGKKKKKHSTKSTCSLYYLTLWLASAVVQRNCCSILASHKSAKA